ncbi:UreD-domain-containing protein [Punctularia strigosozonata HHB-11173 SS5]|uniref:UreD-domain-containing protein n=1 Tax=Punctularia strigosozonata (strain HHB-11173) TaxID=741275 RepID=UPI00044172FE|nr:UreD-domain-containing protein [Punctularia strigosozonata HHB-11173 SS5]EIN14100.1 UreD-domain-containing protein [Punctularia strigosozonata HHB-11173 SS5]
MIADPLLNADSSGRGLIKLECHGSAAKFSQLSAKYPLKLLSPRVSVDGVAVVYILSYGGGLVGGDTIDVRIEVGRDAVLLLLSQGSTKVFKTRPGRRASQDITATTTQAFTTEVKGNGTVLLLPDPVTCFRSASYHQSQVFHLSGAGSAAILDWFTSGRKALGEEWAFTRYHSVNELWVEGKLIAKDAMLLEDPSNHPAQLSTRGLRERLSPYSCYANLLLYGPVLQPVIQELTALYDRLTVFKRTQPEPLIWSLSPISGQLGYIVRAAGMETEDVKQFLARALRPLQAVVGEDLYGKTFL